MRKTIYSPTGYRRRSGLLAGEKKVDRSRNEIRVRSKARGDLLDDTIGFFHRRSKAELVVLADRPLAKSGVGVPVRKTSQLLREILTKHPKVKAFTVKQILGSIGNSGAASLLAFSVPAMIPVVGSTDLAGLPASLIAGQMAVGRTKVKLPDFIMRRSVSRRSLTVAIRAVLPALEAAEKVTKTRWLWLSHPVVQQLLGIFILVLALAIAVPFTGANAPHAAAIFLIALGLAEKDGYAIAIGVLVGLASLFSLAAFALSGNFWRLRSVKWAKLLTTSSGLKWVLRLCLKLAVWFLKKFGLRAALLFLFGSELRNRSSVGASRGKRSLVDLTANRKGAALPKTTGTRLTLGHIRAMERVSVRASSYAVAR